MSKKRVQEQEEESFLEEKAAQAEAWDEEDLGLDWDESEFRRIASDLQTERGTRPL